MIRKDIVNFRRGGPNLPVQTLQTSLDLPPVASPIVSHQELRIRWLVSLLYTLYFLR